MKACMVAYTFYETDNRVRRYAETLARRGDAVEAIVLRREGQPPFEVINDVRVYRIQKRVRDERGAFSYLRKLLSFFVRSAWVLARHHLKSNYDIVHVHSVPDFQVFASLLPRLLGAKVILDIHDIVPELYASKFNVSERSLVFRLLLLMEKLSTAFSNHVIIANHLWYEKLSARAVRPGKCTPIINYPDPAIFFPRPSPARSNSDFVMCYPGTLNSHQGLDLAVRAVALLREKAPQLKFLILGDGPDRDKLKNLVRQLHLEDQVRITGLIPMEQVAETMSTIDLGVVPKRKGSFGNEAFSTKIMEFMAMNVPVVVANTRIDQYYFDKRIVEFFESENVDDLAAKILGLINNPARREELRERASKFIQSNNWNVKKNEYLDLVDHLVSKKPVSPDKEVVRPARLVLPH